MESQAVGGTSKRLAMSAVGCAMVLMVAACGSPGTETSASADEAAVAASTTSIATDPDDPDDPDTIVVTDGDETTATDGDEATATDGDGSADASDQSPTTAGGDVSTEGGDGDEPADDVSAAGESGGGETEDPSVPATMVTTTDIDTLDGPELEDFVTSRYEAFWDAFGQARARPSATPTTDYPGLADLATDEQLDQANAELVALAEQGQALRSPSTPAVPGLDNDAAHRIRVDALDDAVAELTVCFVNDRISYQVADGAIISDAVVTVTAQATMVRTDGTWKLVRSRAVALDPGVAGCWLEGESRYPW